MSLLNELEVEPAALIQFFAHCQEQQCDDALAFILHAEEVRSVSYLKPVGSLMIILERCRNFFSSTLSYP